MGVDYNELKLSVEVKLRGVKPVGDAQMRLFISHLLGGVWGDNSHDLNYLGNSENHKSKMRSATGTESSDSQN